jgi:hypothetical protein
MDVAYDKRSSPQPDSFLSGGGEMGRADQRIRLVRRRRLVQVRPGPQASR